MVSQLSQLEEQLKSVYQHDLDMVEIRLDALEIKETTYFKEILEQIKIPYILSLRSEWLNEDIRPPINGRIPFLKKIIELKPNYLSFEYPLDMNLIKYISEETTPVITLVDFEGIAKIAFNSVLPYMEQHPNYILKITANPNNINDLLTVWRWSRICNKKNVKHVIIGLGRIGRFSRLLSRQFGNAWTYARINIAYEEPKLPGMVPIKFIRRALHPNARVYVGLCKNNSKQLEKLFFTILDDSDDPVSYLNIDTPQIPDLNQMILWAMDGIISGLYISQDWQEQVVNILDAKDQSVVNTGRCNMIMHNGKGIKGYNTIVMAITRLLSPYSKIKRVYIEGTDLDILSFITALRGFDLIEIVVRTREFDIIDILKRINPKVIHHSDAFMENYDIIINCKLPDRGFENVLTIKKQILENAVLIIDPASKLQGSPLIKYAVKNNISHLEGWDIFSNSIIEICELWLDVQLNDYNILNKIEFIEQYSPRKMMC